MHYNGANTYSFVNGTEIVKFKAKDSEIVATPLLLGNILKDFSVDNRKKTGFYEVNDTLDIHKYLMKKHDIK